MTAPPAHDPTAARGATEIYGYTTAKHVLNIYDALRIEKLKIELASNDPATGQQTGRALAWLDRDEMRLLIHLVTFRLFPGVLTTNGRPPRFEKFGGSERDGVIESRTLRLEWDPGLNGRFAGYPYRLTLTNGPGQRLATGAVQPHGEPTSTVALRLPESDLIEMLLAVGAYMHAREVTLAQAHGSVRPEESRSGSPARGAGQGVPASLARALRPAAPEEDAPAGPLSPGPPPPGRPPPAPGGARPAIRPSEDPWAGMDVTETPPRGARRSAPPQS